MSDLHRAVQTRIAAHTPDVAPPFDALKHRKRSRERRRYALAGGALSALVVSVAAFGSTGGSSDRVVPPGVGAPAEDQAQQLFTVRLLPASERPDNLGEGVQECLELPGAGPALAMLSMPPQYSVTVTGADEIAAFERCANAVPGYYAERQEASPMRDRAPAQVEIRVAEPVVAGQPARIEAVIRDDRDVAVHRVEFGDGVQEVTRFTCADGGVRPAPAGPQTHVVEHTWATPGDYTLTVHYGPPCRDETTSASHAVTVTN